MCIASAVFFSLNIFTLQISTPSRLVGHLDTGDLELTECLETIVVDEADLVLSFGYRDDMRTLTARLPNICQVKPYDDVQ